MGYLPWCDVNVRGKRLDTSSARGYAAYQPGHSPPSGLPAAVVAFQVPSLAPSGPIVPVVPRPGRMFASRCGIDGVGRMDMACVFLDRGSMGANTVFLDW
jgi:hypothetical protein